MRRSSSTPAASPVLRKSLVKTVNRSWFVRYIPKQIKLHNQQQQRLISFNFPISLIGNPSNRPHVTDDGTVGRHLRSGFCSRFLKFSHHRRQRFAHRVTEGNKGTERSRAASCVGMCVAYTVTAECTVPAEWPQKLVYECCLPSLDGHLQTLQAAF